MIGVVHSFLNFGQKLTKDVGTGLIIGIFSFIVLRFKFLSVKIDIGFVEVTFGVDFL